MLTDKIIKRLENLEIMNDDMAKYGGPEGKIAWSGRYPKTIKARIEFVKDDELYVSLLNWFNIYFIIRINRG